MMWRMNVSFGEGRKPTFLEQCFSAIQSQKTWPWTLPFHTFHTYVHVLRRLLPTSSLLECSSMQSQPAYPVLHWPGEQQTHCAGGLSMGSWWCQFSHFRNGCLILGKEITTAGINWASIFEVSLEKVPNQPRCWKSSKRQNTGGSTWCSLWNCSLWE